MVWALGLYADVLVCCRASRHHHDCLGPNTPPPHCTADKVTGNFSLFLISETHRIDFNCWHFCSGTSEKTFLCTGRDGEDWKLKEFSLETGAELQSADFEGMVDGLVTVTMDNKKCVAVR